MEELSSEDERIVQDELWHRGELSWKLHSAQLEIYNQLITNNNKLFVANTSRRFGKSYLMVLYTIERALRTPNTKIRYGAAYQTDLEEYIFPEFNLILNDCPTDITPIYKQKSSKYIFKNGSEIKLFGVDKNPNSARGNSLSVIVLDECGFMVNLDYIYKSVIIPATMYQTNVKIIMISTPSETPDHEFKDYCEKAKLENSYVEFDIYKNPMVTPEDIAEYAAELGGFNSTAFRREYLCQFVTEENRAIIPEWTNKYILDVERPDYFEYIHKYISMDLGTKVDLTAVLFGYYDFPNARLIIEDEFTINGPEMTTQILSELITEHETNLQYTNIYKRISDRDNPLLLQDLSIIHDIHFIATSKDNLHAMVNKIREWITQGRIIINPRCKQLIGCLESGIWDKSRTQFDRSKVYGHYDALASLIYLVRNIDIATNPIPITFGINRKDIYRFYFPEQETNGKEKILKNAFRK